MAEKDISFFKGQIAVRGQGQTTCVHHKEKTLDWFCETCHDVICVDCISALHKGHDTIRLSIITPNNKHKIENFITDTEQKQLIQIQKEIKYAQDSLEKHLGHFKSVAEEVQKKGKELKNTLDDLIAGTLSQLKNLEDENTKILIAYKTELEKKLAELKEQLNQCKETLQTGTDIQVFDVKSRLPTVTTSPKRPSLGFAKFNQNKDPFESLTNAFGKMALISPDGHVLAEDENSATSSESQLIQSVDKTSDATTDSAHIYILSMVLFELDSPCNIYHICPSDDGILACGSFERNLLHLTSTVGLKQQIESPVCVTDISISHSTQKVWVCSEDDNSVMRLKSGTWLTSNKFVRKFYTKDEPKCLCVTKDDHVLVGTTNGITKYTAGGKSILSTITQSDQPLVRSPRTISECPISGNIAVLDGDLPTDGGENKPVVIVMDKHLQELNWYGHHQHSSRLGSQTFYPMDVTYDSQGRLLVADYKNDCLHILSGDVQYLGQLYTAIERPQAVCVDKQGVLWVASGYVMFRADSVRRLLYKME